MIMSLPAILPPSKNRQFSTSHLGHFHFALIGHYHFAVTLIKQYPVGLCVHIRRTPASDRARWISDKIRTIQELLGHKNLQTTMIYKHVVTKNVPGSGALWINNLK